jgi:nitric oxide reductase NorD protein
VNWSPVRWTKRHRSPLRRRSGRAGATVPLPPPAADLRPLDRLASAVAGQRVHVFDAGSAPSHVVGTTIGVASEDHAGQGSLAVLPISVLSALLGAGSLEAPGLGRVLRTPGAMSRYVTLEATRVAGQPGSVLPPSVAERIRAHWSGPAPRDAAASVEAALGRRDIPPAPSSFGVLLRGSIGAAATAPPPSDLELDELDEGDAQEEEAEERERRSAADSHIAVAAPWQNPLTKLMRSILGGQSRSDHDGGGDSGVRSATASDANPSRQARVVRGTLPRRSVADPTPVGDVYDEWDCHLGTYRPQWCRVVQFDPAPRADATACEPAGDRRLARALLRMATGSERHGYQFFGDALDQAALVDFEVARRAGWSPDGRVYQDRRRTARDLAVLVLLDCSGSGAESRDGLRIWDEQRRATALLLRALDAAGIRAAAHGFNSHGRQMRFLRVKGFDEPYGGRTWNRLTDLEPVGFTRMGAAVRHATCVLRREGPTARTLLIVISDGLPYDDGYEDRYAEADTRVALEEAAVSGVACACFAALTTTPPDALDRVWGTATHAVLPRGRNWVNPIEPALRAALASVSDRQRPPSNRKARR